MSEDWRSKARCRQEDPRSMQPDAATHAEVAEALLVCEGCQVRDLCRQAAEDQPAAYGVWAGLWWGELPVWEQVKVCAHTECGAEFRTKLEGNRAGDYCSPRCRVAAYRARAKSAGILSA